ncbi:MAG: hypothetical protein V7459_08110 [Oceanicoccus sp.]
MTTEIPIVNAPLGSTPSCRLGGAYGYRWVLYENELIGQTSTIEVSVGAILTADVRPGVVVLSTGTWFDPENLSDPFSLDLRGNPNTLTRDVGTSTLSQGTSAHTAAW